MARKVDDLGRIVLPVELRRLHGIQTGDALEISVDGDAIVLRKLSPGCVFCGAEADLSSYRDRAICRGCRDELTTPAPVSG
jgi:transcriptional pleiotropic regulator of transition state genes